ncbi:MAG: SusD/RagB family nutrient-binding outer membrane lipoprotein [Bacteroidetes bacterium]|nr:MAG: SusD/RagB family nutrient-binding outer membrane lipoprotein [Bacteroidota bacterium]
MKKILLILLVLFVASSCTKLDEMNEDTKNPSKVPSETLFTNAQRELADQLASINVNTNVFKLFAQYITETTYTDEANYDVVNRTIPDNAWRTLYKDVLMDLKESARVMDTEPAPILDSDKKNFANRKAVVDILRVYTYARLLAMFGNIPYTEALDINNVNPKYDDAASVYKSLFASLDADIATLTAGAGEGSFTGGADIIYNGDDAKWLMFANGLKLKMAIQTSDMSPLDAADLNKAIQDAAMGVFTSSADNALFNYLGATPNTNPLYLDLVASGRHDFVATNTMVDIMLAKNDTIRLDMYYTKVADTVASEAFKGGPYGYNNTYSDYSHINSTLEDPTFPCVLMDYTEIQFYLAEAAVKGLGGINGPSAFYDAAVTSSFEYWGSDAATAAAYILADAPYVDINSIGEQAWIAYYNRGFFGWTTWRRIDVPTLNDPPNNYIGLGKFPTRYIYPINEQTLNKANRSAAAAAIGGDFQDTKLFWDIK